MNPIIETFVSNWKLLFPIFKYPTKGLSLREIAKMSSLSHTYVRKKIRFLIKEGVVFVEKRYNAHYVYGNYESEKFIEMKKYYNLLSLTNLKEYLIKEYSPKVIILFGSYSRGEDTEKSDIDLYVGGASSISDNENLRSLEEELHRKIDLFTKPLGEYPQELIENIINGIKIYGWIDIWF